MVYTSGDIVMLDGDAFPLKDEVGSLWVVLDPALLLDGKDYLLPAVVGTATAALPRAGGSCLSW